MTAPLRTRIQQRTTRWRDDWQVIRLSRQLARHAHPDPSQKPVAFFNASTRLSGLSQNAAFALLTALGLQIAGVPVAHFVCRSGLSRCVLGTNPDDHRQPPPCRHCIGQARWLSMNAPAVWFDFERDESLAGSLEDLDVGRLAQIEHGGLPLGELVLPSLRWALRRHTLQDDPPTRFLLRTYLLSAWRVAQAFEGFLERLEPASVVIFNGLMYPEAAARQVALKRGLRVITHEVGFQPFSAFFTDGQATAYPINIPDDFELSPEQNARLDDYLERRFQGKFTMAGIRFWPEMQGLDDSILLRGAHFKQIVPVFTNVIYDTSQVHANTLFPHMFAWLDMVGELIRDHPETLFVIRAHPDEKRIGTRKISRESVSDWVTHHQLESLPNVIFIDATAFVSSYDLIQRAKLVMIYNSSIGLEASLLGIPVLCGGHARFTQYPTVFLPETAQAYRQQAERFLAAERIEVPGEFQRNARRFQYYQLYRASLPFNNFIQANPYTPGYVSLQPFNWHRLKPENSPTIRVLVDGIVHGKPFLLPENQARVG